MPDLAKLTDRSWSWSVAFWCTVPVSLYGSLFAMTGEWWWTVGATAVAVVALVVWAKRSAEISIGRARQVWRWTFAVVLVVCALGLFAVVGTELLWDKNIGVGDTMDPRTVACGSVMDPRPNDMLTAEFPEDFPLEAREQLAPIPRDSFAMRCDERLDSSANFAIATALGALQLAVRAAIHIRRRRAPAAVVSTSLP